MRKEFEMTEEQLETLLEACKPVPYMVFGGVEPTSLQENACRAWDVLGKEMGFKGKSVEPIAYKSQRFFTAEEFEGDDPLLIFNPK